MTNTFTFRNIHPEEVREASEIEKICFPPEEACSLEHMTERVKHAPDLFLTAFDKESGKMAGFINGISTNEDKLRDAFYTDISLCDPDGRNIMILGVDVLPQYRHQGLARKMMHLYQKQAYEKNYHKLVLTCLEGKVEMYQKFGFKDNGISDSEWGRETWHEMVYLLKP